MQSVDLDIAAIEHGIHLSNGPMVAPRFDDLLVLDGLTYIFREDRLLLITSGEVRAAEA